MFFQSFTDNRSTSIDFWYVLLKCVNLIEECTTEDQVVYDPGYGINK